MSSNLKVNSLVPATGTEIGIGTTGGSIDFRCPATFGGNVTIGGTLTYDEVINIDSIGIVTARSGLNVQAGQLDVGSNIKLGNAGVVTATTFSGSGASLTGIANANISASAAIGGEKINPAFTSNVTITNTAPRLDFVDSNNNSDYRITNSNGTFVFYDTTNAATRLSIASNGNVSVTNDLDVDGHTNLDNVSISGITTTNQITISSSGPRLTFSDSNENPDFYIEVNASQFLIQDATANAQRFRIQSNGVVDINGNTNFGGGIDVTGGPITVTGNIDVVTTGTNVGVAVTQNGTGNILNLYDGSNLRFAVNQYGNPTVTSGNPVYASTNSSSNVTTTLFSNSAGQGVLQTNSGHSLILGTGAV